MCKIWDRLVQPFYCDDETDTYTLTEITTLCIDIVLSPIQCTIVLSPIQCTIVLSLVMDGEKREECCSEPIWANCGDCTPCRKFKTRTFLSNKFKAFILFNQRYKSRMIVEFSVCYNGKYSSFIFLKNGSSSNWKQNSCSVLYSMETLLFPSYIVPTHWGPLISIFI